MASVTFEMEGLTRVQSALTEAGVVKIPTALRKVTVAGAKPLRASIRAATPVGKKARPQQGDVPGNLRKGVRYKASRGSKGMRYTIGAFGKGTAHRALVISGHRIKGGGGRTRPNPFIERGAAAGAGPAVAALETAAAAAIRAVTG